MKTIPTIKNVQDFIKLRLFFHHKQEMFILVIFFFGQLAKSKCNNDYIPNTVEILFYDRNHSNEPVDLQAENFTSLIVDVAKPFKVICHGWLNNDTDAWYPPIIQAYLGLNYNVIALNWTNYSNKYYRIWGSDNLQLVTNLFSDTLINFYKEVKFSPHLVHFIGHSVGAHILSCVAKNLQVTLGILIGRITALDPAGPLHNFNISYIALKQSDAKFVDVIHTNAGERGTSQELGDIDFWVNGGSIQSPICSGDTNSSDALGYCSHNIAPDYYVASITCNGFIGRKCSNYFSFTFGRCGNSKAIMGDNVDQSLRGNYFLNTNDEPPFAVGAC